MTSIPEPILEPQPVADDDGPQRFSVSQAGTFDRCPRRWWWQYIIGVDDPPGRDARRGTLVHTALEHLTQLPPGERTVAAAERIVFEHWRPGDLDSSPDPPALRRAAWRNVLRALNLPQVTEPVVLATEVSIKGVVLDGVPLSGFIDRVAQGENGVEIDDYKDGNRRTDSRSKAEKKRQVIIYAAAYPYIQQGLTSGGVATPTHASLIYTAAGEVDRYPVTEHAVRTAVDWLKDRWDELRTARATGDFPVRPGPLCSWCPAVDRCPQGTDAVRARARNPAKSLGDHGRRALTVAAEGAA